MTAKDSVIDLLEKQRESAELDEHGRLQAWISAVQELIDQFRRWLTDAERRGLVKVEQSEYPVQETPLGSVHYLRQLAIITPKGIPLRIIPKALHVVGANGRVDFECPPKRLSLLRTEDNQWKFAKLSANKPGWELTDLSEESFWEALRDLLS